MPVTSGAAPSRRWAPSSPRSRPPTSTSTPRRSSWSTDPGRFDVIVTDNLFGDILTDIAAAIAGGIGLAASGNINPARTTPSMFEPVHGSAPDIAGQSKADPTAAILSVGMMLAHLGLDAEAARVEAAVEADLAERGDAVRSTTAIGDAVVSRL